MKSRAVELDLTDLKEALDSIFEEAGKRNGTNSKQRGFCHVSLTRKYNVGKSRHTNKLSTDISLLTFIYEERW